MNQFFTIKIFLSLLLLISIFSVCYTISACDRGAAADLTEANCQSKGFVYKDGACVAATVDDCLAYYGVTATIGGCTAEADVQDAYCEPAKCKSSVYATPKSKTPSLANCNAAGFKYQSSACVAPTISECRAMGWPSFLCINDGTTHDIGCQVTATAADCKAIHFIPPASNDLACIIPTFEYECWTQGLAFDSTTTPKSCKDFGKTDTKFDQCPIQDGDLFDITKDAAGVTVCKPSGAAGCKYLGYKLGVAADTGYEGYCYKDTTTCGSFPVSQTASLFTFDVTTTKCFPKVKAACLTLGLKWISDKVPCGVPTGISDCPDSDLWTVSKSQCVPKNEAACWTLGLSYTNSGCKIPDGTIAKCPYDNALLWLFNTATSQCEPQRAEACQGLGLKFNQNSKACEKVTTQKDCPIDNLWKYVSENKVCLTKLKKACYHFGLNKDSTAIGYCTVFSKSECEELLTGYFEYDDTTTGLCLAKNEKGCLFYGMIFEAKKCLAPNNKDQCARINQYLEYGDDSASQVTPNYPTTFGCKPISSSGYTGIALCLTKGLGYDGTYCSIKLDSLSTGDYSSDLLTKEDVTNLMYPKVKEGCAQQILGFVSVTEFCQIPTASSCKNAGLIWTEYYTGTDISTNCLGTLVTKCIVPTSTVTSSTCPSGSYYAYDSSITKISKYPCISACPMGTFYYNNVCFAKCPSLVGLVTTQVADATKVIKCIECTKGCTSCTSEILPGECSGCLDGYFLNNKACSSCAAIPNCEKCGSATSCLNCVTSFQKFTSTSGTTSKDTCVSCTDTFPYCKTCKLDDTGKYSQCQSCQDQTIMSTTDTTLIERCVCKTLFDVLALRTSINDVTTPLIGTYKTYTDLQGFYRKVKCYFLEVPPVGCEIIIDATKDLAILNKVLDQLLIIIKQESQTFAASGFTPASFISLFYNFIDSVLAKSLDSATVKKAFTVLNHANINSTTATYDGIILIINKLLEKTTPSLTSYADFQSELSASFVLIDKILLSTQIEAKIENDYLSYEAYVFDKIKPTGLRAGLTLDLTGSNTTLFEGKVIDFSKAKLLIGKFMLKNPTRVSSVNGTTISPEFQFSLGQLVDKVDATTNITIPSFSAIDDIVIPSKQCATISLSLKTAYTQVDKNLVIYIAQWDETKKIWDVNAVTTSNVANPYVGCVKTLVKPFVVTSAKKKGSNSSVLALTVGLFASLLLLF